MGSIWTMLTTMPQYGLVVVPLGLGAGLATCCPILAGICFLRFDWEAIAAAAAAAQDDQDADGNEDTLGKIPSITVIDTPEAVALSLTHSPREQSYGTMSP